MLCEKMQIDDTIDFKNWMNPTNQVGKYKDHIQSLEALCEEISEISNQCERFKKHLASMFTENLEQQDMNKSLKRTQSTRDKDKKEEGPIQYLTKIENLQMTQILVELLDKFIFYQKVALVIFLNFLLEQ